MKIYNLSDFSPKAVLFDMDGVILDTEPISLAGWRAGLEAQGYTLSSELYGRVVGTSKVETKARMEAFLGEGFDYEAAANIRNAHVHSYRDQYGVELKKGVLNLLDTLDNLNIPCCVATSTDKARAEEFLNSKGITGRFKHIIGGDCIARSKPAPDIYLKAAEEMNVPPEECLAIEDSRLGTESAYNAGVRVIVVPDLQPPDEATYARAFTVCKDLDEVAGLVKGLFPAH